MSFQIVLSGVAEGPGRAADDRNEGALPPLRQVSGKVIPAAGLWPFWVMDGLSSMLAGRWFSLIYCSVIKTKNVCSVGLLMAFRNCKLNTNQKGLFKNLTLPLLAQTSAGWAYRSLAWVPFQAHLSLVSEWV